jgi:hypothetical protein
VQKSEEIIMAQTRAWQTVEAIADKGIQRISYVEIDFAAGSSYAPADLQYVPFTPQQPTKLMVELAQTIAQFGEQAPQLRSVLVIGRGSTAPHFAERYPHFKLPEYAGSTLLSADAAEIALITRGVRDGTIQITGKRPALQGSRDSIADYDLLQAMLERIWFEERVVYYPAGKTDFRGSKPLPNTIDLVVPFSLQAGYLSQEAVRHGALAACNAGFFVWVEEEFADPFSFATDHVGLLIVNGTVVNAPLFQRSALILTRNVYRRAGDEATFSLGGIRPLIRQVSLNHYAVKLGSSLVVHGPAFRREHIAGYFGATPCRSLDAALNPRETPPNGAAFYNRMLGLSGGNATATHTPPARDRVELTIVGEHICAVKEGGETFIPKNGLVVSLPGSNEAGALISAALLPDGLRIKQAIDLGDDALYPTYGVQVGPQIIRHGQPIDVGAQLHELQEEYIPCAPQRGEEGVPPVFLTPSHQLSGGRARIGFGIRPDQRCYLALIEGCEPRTFFSEFDSMGGDMDDLVRCLLKLGCDEAITFDGGGSAQIVYKNQSIARVADRNDVPFMPGERIIPGGWMFFA